MWDLWCEQGSGLDYKWNGSAKRQQEYYRYEQILISLDIFVLLKFNIKN